MEIFNKKFREGSFIIYNQCPEFDFKKVKQIHSTKIVPIKKDYIEADGLLLKKNEKDNLAILTADCMPILLLGKNGSTLIHAGWRGLKAGILKQDQLKDLKIYQAFIGPHIKNCCYEVTSEFLDHFPKSFFIKKEDKYFFSLHDVARAHLKEFFGDIKVEHAKECTSCHLRFHSYRRDQTTKRNWNIWKPNVVDTIHTYR